MERRHILIRGIVQGVGFRPFVHNLASRLALHGFVKNETGDVLIEIEGEESILDRFLAELEANPPRLARIEDVRWERVAVQGDERFRIEASSHQDGPIFLSPDVAACADCIRELFDLADRRHGYPFTNCTNCGPRLTIIQGAPYDRARTTMASFPMCLACQAEYDDPTNRRFHAQPIACADCGPQLRLVDESGAEIRTPAPLAAFAAALRSGKIGAVKGLGGFHLACDAGNQEAVRTLRQRKHRDEKPFAIMLRDLDAVASLCELDAAERSLLNGPASPIVLLRKKAAVPIAEEVAPGNPYLGVMLPCTPLHHLLLRAVDGMPLVMTSGNRSDEPIAYRDDEALANLAGIADLFLMHDRPIHVRCDDSVTRMVDGQELLIRRSRGYAPGPIGLPLECPEPILAAGGQLKATFALGRDRQAFLSHHLGDLDYFEAFQAFTKDVELYEKLFAVRPRCLVRDMHPDYATTRWAVERAAMEGIPVLAVQHHHAHMASCMAEHGLVEPVIGVTFDGTGYGSDGTIWGGEFLIGDYHTFRRAAHLRGVRMPGGDQAIREPWRMALAYLADAQVADGPWETRFLPYNVKVIRQMLERGIQAPLTSSAGRLFDAVAALAGIRDRVNYEGQAAVELEWLASGVEAGDAYPFGVEPAGPGSDGLVIDTRPLVVRVADQVKQGIAAAILARRFHSTMVEIIGRVCNLLRRETGINTVVLSGGVFLNALLVREAHRLLEKDGFRCCRHRLVPPNDGGLSLGQLAIAAATMQNRTLRNT